MKPLISFKTLDKYKYVYFVLSSLFLAFCGVLGAELGYENSIFTLKHLLRNTLFFWGVMYLPSFYAYEIARRNNKKLQEKLNNKQEEKE